MAARPVIFMVKRLMILGAGIFQLPGIIKARDLGFYVITLDNIPDNIGHKYSHEFVNCSTTDIDEVVNIAKIKAIDGICTFSSDVAIPAVAAVCSELGLSGINDPASIILTQKHMFRKFLFEHGYPNPKYLYSSEYKDLENISQSMKYPIIFKPVDASGSRGLTVIESNNPLAENEAFNIANNYSRCGVVCIEEFIDEREYGGDGFIVNGELKFLAVTSKYLNGFIVTGHRYPSDLDNNKINDIGSLIESICKDVGYRDGPINFDIMHSINDIYVLEMSPRNGGNGIPAVIQYVTGVDLEAATIKSAFGEDVDLTDMNLNAGAGSFIFGSNEEGVLRNIVDCNVLTKEVPNLIDVVYAKNIGERVTKFEHNGNLIGYALFECESLDDYHKITEAISNHLDIEIDNFE